ncbi:MAG: HAD family phosphatase [Lachnospiraceae bacterium]|nr:HAD family phosphatase [Lachnospiraceae bacterium]
MIKNIVFDIGNVLTDFRYMDFLKDKGLTDEEIKAVVKASVEHPNWNEFDRGVLTRDECLLSFIASAPELESKLHIAYDDISGMVTPRDYAIPWIKSLKDKGYKVYYLSNFSKAAEDECAESLSFIPYTDGGILSYRVKLIKPDPAIYRLFLSTFGLNASECVFIDDKKNNIDAAISEGWSGIVFKSKEQVEEELEKLLKS